MTTRHSYALSRQPRSLPLLVLYTRNGIFNRVSGRKKFIRALPANQLPAAQT
jgi:hypothetical protein